MVNYYDIEFQATALNSKSKDVNVRRNLKRTFRGFASELSSDELMTLAAQMKNYISRKLYKMGYVQADVTDVKVVTAQKPKSRKSWIKNLESLLQNE